MKLVFHSHTNTHTDSLLLHKTSKQCIQDTQTHIPEFQTPYGILTIDRNYTCRLTLKQCTFRVVSMVKTPPLNDHLFSRLSNYSSVVSYRQTPEIIMINHIAGTKNGPGFTS